MGWRYRKRIKIFPGIHINISKSGISTNVGVKGASVTFGPKGNYVNTGLPGTGLYRRDKVSADNISSESTEGDWGIGSEILAKENINTQDDCFKILKNGFIKIPVFKPLYYFAYFIAIIMPFIGLTLYAYGEWWMFFSCLFVDFIQLITFVILNPYDIFDENSCYKVIVIKNNEKTIKKEKIGHIIRCIMASILALSNLFPVFAMSKNFVSFYNYVLGYKIGLYYFRQEPYDGNVIVFLMMIIIMMLWIFCIIKEFNYFKLLNHFEIEYEHCDDNKGDEIKEPLEEQNTMQKDEAIISTHKIAPLSRNIILGNLINKHEGIPISSLSHQELNDALGKSLNPNASSAISREDTMDILSQHTKVNDVNSSSLEPKPVEENISQPYEQHIELYDPKNDLVNYHYPTIALLKTFDSDNKPCVDMKEQGINKNRIIDLLWNFGIAISSIKATVGPRVTLYEILLAPGISVTKMRGLENDIALALCSHDVQIIAPLPGKGTIGIEVPNIKPSMVSMASVLNSKRFQVTTMELPCAIGKTNTNEVFMFDLAKAPHILIGGSTGQGKSVAINAIITSLLYKKHPAELKLVLMEPSGLELSSYVRIANHFLASLPNEPTIITNSTQATNTLNALCVEMENRYNLLQKAQARDVRSYNEKFSAHQLNPAIGHKYMPYIVVIIDEYGNFIEERGIDIEQPITSLAQFARAVGIHLIISTKRPTNDIITGTIKANFPTRISFRVPERIDSRVILDRDGAERLLGNGDMLYVDGGTPIRVQCASVDTHEIECICSYISRQQSYVSTFELPEPNADDSNGGESQDVDMKYLDPMLEETARLIVREQSGSSSLIQRKFSIGYNRAGRLMDQLEKIGVVGAEHGTRPREVLIQDEISLNNLLNNLKIN